MESPPNPPPAAKDSVHPFESMPSKAEPPPLPVRVEALDYFRPNLHGSIDWVLLARYQTPGQWHSARAALSNANIIAMMNVLPAEETLDGRGFELLVSSADLPLAVRISEAHHAGQLFCPRCGSTSVCQISAAWYWYILAVLFLMYPPYWPSSKRCEACGNKWG
jgi:hypothetical protein